MKNDIGICLLVPLLLMVIVMMLEFVISNVWVYILGTLVLILLVPLIFNKLCNKKNINMNKIFGCVYISLLGGLINIYIYNIVNSNQFILAFNSQIHNDNVTIQEPSVIDFIVILLIMVITYCISYKGRE